MYKIKNNQNGMWVRNTGANFGLTSDEAQAMRFTEAEKTAFIERNGSEWEAQALTGGPGGGTNPPGNGLPDKP
jgi:hypothetical protein